VTVKVVEGWRRGDTQTSEADLTVGAHDLRLSQGIAATNAEGLVA
jgi:hypothetical protein